MTIDYVVKLGGSLLSNLEKTAEFLRKIAAVESTCLFTVGSGPLGDAYKALAYERRTSMPFDLYVECWSGIQSINARLIASIHPSFALCSDIRQIENCITKGLRPIIDAKDFAHYYKRLRYQMSDVRSALVAHLLGCRKLVIFTDVDGIFSGDPRTDPSARRLDFIEAYDPILQSRTSVDEGLAEHLIEYGVTTFVAGIECYLESDLTLSDYLRTHSSVISPTVSPEDPDSDAVRSACP